MDETEGPAPAPARRSLRPASFAALFVAAFAILGVRMVMIATADIPERRPTSAQAEGKLRAQLHDRAGRIIASDLSAIEVFINPKIAAEAGGISHDALDSLKRIYPNMDRNRVRRKVELGEGTFEYIAHEATPAQWEETRYLGVTGIEKREVTARIYPPEALVAHLVGGVFRNRNGIRGVEAGLNDQILSTTGARPAPIPLSIDLRIQHAMRDTLWKARAQFDAVGAMGLMMDVRTGEVLSLVSLPDFDPNDRPSPASGEPTDGPVNRRLFNRVTQGSYELGSIFKLLTAAIALDSGTATLDSVFDARRPIVRGGYKIDDYFGKYTMMSLREVVKNSSNIGAVLLAETFGVEIHQAYLKRFGLEGLSPLPELSVVDRGPVQIREKWEGSSAATPAYGQGIAVTPMHFAAAIASIVNGGCKVQPTLLRIDGPPEGCERLVSEDVSKDVRMLMRTVVESGSGALANIAGYEVGGKTGTAEKPDETGSYAEGTRLNTFVAVWPMDAPRWLLMTSLDEPKIIDGSSVRPTAGHTTARAAGIAIQRIAPLLWELPADRFRGNAAAAKIAAESIQ